MSKRFTLSDTWCEYFVCRNVDTKSPGIYEWKIDGAGSYIGQFGSIRRPTMHYRRNVVRLMNGEAYRKGKPAGFRRIHLELEKAIRENRRIELHILENVKADKINARELELIKTRGTLNGTVENFQISN
jgi:hypothetical protein